MIGILDYGVGNVSAFLKSFELLDIGATRVRFPSELDQVDGLVLPGVGSFDMVMNRLADCSLTSKVDELVSRDNMPILGVCVGMQVMAVKSEEGSAPGFGWVDGTVKRLGQNLGVVPKLIIPHMGWNTVIPSFHDGLFKDLGEQQFYFLHSYGFVGSPGLARTATADYGSPVVVAFESENIFGVQFHPEKSHNVGLRLLGNFARIVENA